MMSNLLKETKEHMEMIGKRPCHIKHIGNRQYGCTWQEFAELADEKYDSGFGTAEVAEDLYIVFDDGSWLERYEYDGSEGWVHKETPDTGGKEPITSLFAKRGTVSWSWNNLRSIHTGRFYYE